MGEANHHPSGGFGTPCAPPPAPTRVRARAPAQRGSCSRGRAVACSVVELPSASEGAVVEDEEMRGVCSAEAPVDEEDEDATA